MSLGANLPNNSLLTQGSLWPAVALVTGGGSSIGNAVALAFAEAGCRAIAITDNDGARLLKTKDEIIARFDAVTVLTATGNIADEGFINSFVDGIVNEVGRLDYAVNCAGILGTNTTTTETAAQDFDRVNDTNYRGTWLSVKAELRAMLRQEPLQSSARDALRPAQRGAIVNIASQLGVAGRARSTVYSASKAAIIAMTRGDAIDYNPHGIRINCVSPGIIDSTAGGNAGQVGGQGGGQKGQLVSRDSGEKTVMGRRMGRPSEVADAVLFLCSPKASFIQGQNLVVDGGSSLAG